MIEKTNKLNVTGQKQIKQIKVALVGDSMTGKSTFMKKYIERDFNPNYNQTLGVETGDKYMEAKNGMTTHITLWDFSGKLDFADLRNEFYREADVVLVFCDLASKSTIESIDYWVREIKDNGGGSIFVVGNKLDCKKFDGQKIAKDKSCPYFEVSSKTGDGIQEMVQRVMTEAK